MADGWSKRRPVKSISLYLESSQKKFTVFDWFPPLGSRSGRGCSTPGCRRWRAGPAGRRTCRSGALRTVPRPELLWSQPFASPSTSTRWKRGRRRGRRRLKCFCFSSSKSPWWPRPPPQTWPNCSAPCWWVECLLLHCSAWTEVGEGGSARSNMTRRWGRNPGQLDTSLLYPAGPSLPVPTHHGPKFSGAARNAPISQKGGTHGAVAWQGKQGSWASAALAGVAVPTRGWYSSSTGQNGDADPALQRNPLCQCTKKSVTSSQRNPVKSVQPVLRHLGPLSTGSTPTQA